MSKAQKIKIDAADFAAKVDAYISAFEAFGIHASTKSEIEARKPKPKKIYDSIDEYNKYADEVVAYDKEAEEWNDKYKELLYNKEAAESEIIKAIPPTTWIKTTWNDSFVWVGYSTSDWGGGTRTVQISFKEPDNMLSHTEYN